MVEGRQDLGHGRGEGIRRYLNGEVQAVHQCKSLSENYILRHSGALLAGIQGPDGLDSGLKPAGMTIGKQRRRSLT